MADDLPALPGARRRHVRAGDVRLHVAEAGDPDADPVLLVHGWPQHHWCWRAVQRDLARDHRVVAVDLRGFGWSEAPGHGYDPETFAADLTALLDGLGIESAHVAGHDWGGFTSVLLALRRPERVRSVLSASSPLPWAPRFGPRVAREGWRAWYAALLATPLVGRAVVRSGAVEAALRELPPSSRRAYLARIRRPEQADATAALYRRYLLALPLVLAGAERSRLTVPARVLVGARDPAVPAVLLDGAERHCDDVTVELVPGAGHFLPETHAGLVADRARALFAQDGR